MDEESDADPELAAIAEEIEIEVAELESVFADIEQVLHELAEIDVDISDPADLERVRQMLPTEPYRARLLQAALPPALDHALEYVSPSEHQAGYWRRRPERRDPEALSDAQLRHRLDFIEVARDARGESGVVETSDGREIPKAAREIGDALANRNYDFGDDGSPERRDPVDYIDRILEMI